MGSLTIRAVLDDEEKIISIEDDNTIFDLKKKIEAEYGLDGKSFSLSLNDNPDFEFDDDLYLEFCYEIEDNCIIKVEPTISKVQITFENKKFQKTYYPTTLISQLIDDATAYFGLEKNKSELFFKNKKLHPSFSLVQAELDLNVELTLTGKKINKSSITNDDEEIKVEYSFPKLLKPISLLHPPKISLYDIYKRIRSSKDINLKSINGASTETIQSLATKSNDKIIQIQISDNSKNTLIQEIIKKKSNTQLILISLVCFLFGYIFSKMMK